MKVTANIAEAASCLRTGGVVLFETDTVCGIGVSVEHAESPARLFALKRRDEGKPVAWLVSSRDALSTYGRNVPDYARSFAREFWPGALTLVVNASDRVPHAFRAKQGTIGLRMPDHDGVRSLIGELGCPLAVSSANLAGEDAASSLAHVDPAVVQQVDCVLDFDAACGRSGQRASGACASAVLDCTADAPCLLRPGAGRFSRVYFSQAGQREASRFSGGERGTPCKS